MSSKQTFHDQIHSALSARLAGLEQDNARIAASIATNSSMAYADIADQAGSELCNDLSLIQYERNKKTIEQIRSALNDMEHANYGHCKLCGEPIGIKRLLAMPHTTYCIDCREIMDQGPSLPAGYRSERSEGLYF
ncbi:TraR/DksA family transcriptional regulator [Desulfoplanes sp. PS50]